MTIDPGPAPEAGLDAEPEVEPLAITTGRMISLRFLLATFRRTRKAWLTLAALGLLVGVGYHIAVPVKYTSTAALYLTNPANSFNTADVQNDLAMLQSTNVGRRAIALLGPAGRGLTPTSLLGKAPGTMTGGNVLTIAVTGPTPEAAKQRVDAVAKAYLAFRAQVFEGQNQAVVAASAQQLGQLQAAVTALSNRIANLGPKASAQQLASLEAQRASDTTQIIGLQQSIQQANVNTLAVVHGSRVITPGALGSGGRLKVLAVDGLTGLAAGLGFGLVIVALFAILSDKLRRREDLALLAGAPVGVSVDRPGRWRPRRRSLRALGSSPDRSVSLISHYLKEQMASGPSATQMVVAIDDVRATAAALMSLATTLQASDRRVVLVDETAKRSIGRAFGRKWPGLHQVSLQDGTQLTLLIPTRPWEAETEQTWRTTIDDLAGPHVHLVAATVDPAIGAWHLRRWAADAIVTATAGHATLHGIAAVVELLDAAGITVSSSVLLGADRADDSVGLPPVPEHDGTERFALVQTAGAPAS